MTTRVALEIEAIGDDATCLLRKAKLHIDTALPGVGRIVVGSTAPNYWVAEILGPDPTYKLQRKFLRGKKDYCKANSVGSRGVSIWYMLERGKIYEIRKPVSWQRDDRYFCSVTEEGVIERICEKEMKKCVGITSG